MVWSSAELHGVSLWRPHLGTDHVLLGDVISLGRTPPSEDTLVGSAVVANSTSDTRLPAPLDYTMVGKEQANFWVWEPKCQVSRSRLGVGVGAYVHVCARHQGVQLVSYRNREEGGGGQKPQTRLCGLTMLRCDCITFTGKVKGRFHCCSFRSYV